jgi:ABC-2 type transport system permease protein
MSVSSEIGWSGRRRPHAFSDLIAAEFLKMRTTRTFWWVTALGLLLTVLLIVVTLATSTVESEEDARSLLANVGVPGLFMIILGVVGAAGEYRHGTITSTFLVAPDRRRVLVAKALAYGIGGLAVGLVSAAGVLGISAPWLSAQGHPLGSLGLGAGELVLLVAGVLAYLAISGALGVAVGALATNQATALVIVFVVLFVVDPVVGALAHTYGKVSLQGLGAKLSGASGQDVGFDLLPLGLAALVYLGYAAALLAVTAVVDTRRDVG